MRRIRECHDDLFEGELSHRIIGAFYYVYNGLGYGFLESVYRRALARELTRRGLNVAVDVPAEVRFDGEIVGVFKSDILVETRIVLELKAARALSPADEMQVLNYLRATDLELGILLHFGPKPQFRRFINTRPGRRRGQSGVGGHSRAFASLASSASPRPRRTDPESASPRPRRDDTRTPITAPRPPSRDPDRAPPPAACPTP